MSDALTPTQIQDIENSFRRCRPETVAAILQFRQKRDFAMVPTIVFGILERFAPAEKRASLDKFEDSMRLAEDLGLDSLSRLEVVLAIEEALGLQLENQELQQVMTVGEVRELLNQKLQNASTQTKQAPVDAKVFNRDAIMLALPQQPRRGQQRHEVQDVL